MRSSQNILHQILYHVLYILAFFCYLLLLLVPHAVSSLDCIEGTIVISGTTHIVQSGLYRRDCYAWLVPHTVSDPDCIEAA